MLWPETTIRLENGTMSIGGVSLPDLAAQHGTPLYLLDEETLRNRARRTVEAARASYPTARAVYAAKALALPTVLNMLYSEGLGVDVVSAGELHAALASGIPATSIT